jgi:uncharacterized membrane protein
MVDFRRLDDGECAFQLSPNCALGWVRMKRLFWVLAACLGAVSAYFVARGAWLVLPFTGLELAVLALGIYLNARWAAAREVISLHGPDLLVHRGCGQLAEVARLPRHWTRLALVRDPRAHFPCRLFLECHGRRVEVGAALVEGERIELARDLSNVLSVESALHHPPAAVVPVGLGTAGQKI